MQFLKHRFLLIIVIVGALLAGTTAWIINNNSESDSRSLEQEERMASGPQSNVPEPELSRVETKKARGEFFFRLLRDPATNKIPANIRSRELSFAKKLPSVDRIQQLKKDGTPTTKAAEYIWNQAGPTDIGGRTRALGIDSRDPDVIIAGGVSGGIWKSEDGGTTWDLKTADIQSFSVSSLAQDPNSPDTWYYSSGEFLGNSASAEGAPYMGTGIYKSTDNGNSWSQLSSTSDEDASFNSKFDFISRVVVTPSGTVLFSSNGFGVYRSDDGGQTFDGPVVGSEANQIYTDVAVASNGRLAAAISSASFDQGNTSAHDPGIFVSNSDGSSGSWTEVTPGTFPSEHRRSVLAFAPSNPDILYVLTHVGDGGSNSGGEDIRLHKIDLASGTATDLTDNIPDFGGDAGGFWTQSGYDMEIAVKPDNEDFVILGGTNLFRGRNGFNQTSYSDSDKDEYWIGGYSKDNDYSQYPNHHPDQHIIAFDPTDPNRMWSGHDGGLSVTNDITANSISWTDKNNAYLTTQFYTIAIPQEAGDVRIMGGTQDNGSPYFEYNDTNSEATSSDISFGDGGYAFFTSSYLFVSQQKGHVIRYNKGLNGGPEGPFAFVHPSGATEQLFIHPYEVDPNDESIMYYPDGNNMWRNTQVDLITNQDGDGTSNGWTELSSVNVPSGYTISSLEVSKTPANVLYYAGYSDSNTPVIMRLDNANTANNGAQDVSIENAPSGAYVYDIAVSPINSNEALAVMSNYNIVGIYHTIDGGNSWTAVEGNLTGSDATPGPSIRSATIIPAESGTKYLIGTSTGLYSTTNLNGGSTTWGREAINQIGYAIAEYVDSRSSDGDVAVGTHGRGAFYGNFQGTTNAPYVTIDPAEAKAGENVTLTAHDFTFQSNPADNKVTFGGVSARVNSVADSVTMEVEVPRNTVDRTVTTNSVGVSVTSGGTTVATNFTVLPPSEFAVKQNYPNPFNPSTSVPFDIPARSYVTLSIYNTNGQKVREPLRQVVYNSGAYNYNVDMSGLASGVYLYRVYVQAASGEDDAMQTKKMTYIK